MGTAALAAGPKCPSVRAAALALSQARAFTDQVGVTGLMLTKLDGSAKGGVVIAIWNEVKVPVKYIGTGETPADIAPFDPEAFIDEMFDDGDSAPDDDLP